MNMKDQIMVYKKLYFYFRGIIDATRNPEIFINLWDRWRIGKFHTKFAK